MFLSLSAEHECDEDGGKACGALGGHGGADYHTVKAFVDALHV